MATVIGQGIPSVYEFLSDASHYRMLGLSEEMHPPLLMRLSGHSLTKGWKPPHIRVVNPGRGLPASDIAVWESDTPPVLTPRAWRVLGDLLEGHAEPLRLEGAPGMHYIVNVLSLVSALVERDSEVFRFPSGEIVDVFKYALDAEALKPPIFKLSTWPTGRVLVKESFVSRVQENGLKGARFRKVWP